MNKKILAMVCTAVVCLFLGFGFTTHTTAKAQTTLSYTTFTMEKGAAARIKSLTDKNGNDIESNGLRFSAEISQTEYDNLKAAGARFGVVIVASDLLKGTEINAETVFGANPKFYATNEEGGDTSKIAMLHLSGAACANIDEDANVEISGSIVNIQLNNFTRSFVGRAYVAIPSVNAETGATEYTYHFAPYYEDNIDNNTRCIYYIAQRAIEEEKAEATTLKQKYITPFEATSRYQNYTYRYVVEHCYISHHAGEDGEIHQGDESEHEILHTERQYLYATLNSTVTAEPIIKPDDVPAIADINFIYDIDAKDTKATGLVYAGGMQTLRLYYETAGTISEEHKIDTLEALVADFLNVDKAEQNFGLHINGNQDDWVAKEVMDPEGSGKQIGISLTATSNANKNRRLILSQHFFEHLRAFGVESIIFSFHAAPESKKDASYNLYQEEDTSKCVPAYDAETKEALFVKKETELIGQTIDSTEHKKIQIYLKDITVGGGVLIEVTTDSTNNLGQYHFGDISFTFPTTNQEEQGNQGAQG